MLSKRESHLILKWFHFCSLLHVVPFSVNIKEAKLERFERRRFYTWMALYGIAVAHWSFGLIRFVGMIFLDPTVATNVFHLLIQFDALLVPLFFHPVIIFTSIWKADLVCLVFNELFPAVVEAETSSRRKRPWKELSLLELLAALSPVIPIGVVGSYMGMIIIESGMQHLIINSGLLYPFRGWKLVTIAAFTTEMFSVAAWALNIGFLLSISCLVLLKLEADFKTSHNDLRDGAEPTAGSIRVTKALKYSQQRQLYVQLFNSFHAWFVHVLKLVSLSVGIFHAYVGVRFRENIFIGLFCIFIHLVSIIAYCGPFQRAYHVRSQQTELGTKIREACLNIRNDPLKEQLIKSMDALKNTGIHVGSFDEVERNSGLIYINFLETQIVGLLVSS